MHFIFWLVFTRIFSFRVIWWIYYKILLIQIKGFNLYDPHWFYVCKVYVYASMELCAKKNMRWFTFDSWEQLHPCPYFGPVIIIIYCKGRRDEMKLPLNPSVIHLVIRPVMVCLLRGAEENSGGGENSGVQTRRMLKPDLDSESV